MTTEPLFDLSGIPEKGKSRSTRKSVPEETWLQIKEMWAKGLSGSEIARNLGVTRNVVIGLIHRRIGGGARGNFRTTGVRVYSPRSPRLARTYTRREPTPVTAAAPPPPPPEPPPRAVQEDEKTLMAIRYGHHCCFPVRGEGADTIYCGGPTGGKTYCAEHDAVMHIAIKRVNTVGRVTLSDQGYAKDRTTGRGYPAAQAAREVYFGGGRV
jgi:hypothetical protein